MGLFDNPSQWWGSGGSSGVGTLVGGGIGAIIGGPFGALAGSSIGGSFGGMLSGKNEANERQYEMRKMRDEAQQRANQKFDQQKLDPEKLKQEYQQKLQRSMQQAYGGIASSISGQRGMNPAMAAHLIGNKQSELGATVAGESALAQEQMAISANQYNNQLQNSLFSQEMGYGSSELNYLSQGRQQDEQRMSSFFNTLGTVGMMGLNSQFNKDTAITKPSQSAGYSFNKQGYGLGISDYGSGSSSFASYDHMPMHMGLSSMFMNDQSNIINSLHSGGG